MKAAALLSRMLFAGFQLLTSLYCLLAYLPFTYHQVHSGGLLPWLDRFVQIHPWLNLAVLALVLATLVEPWQRGGVARWLAAGFGIGQLAFGYWLTLHPVLSTLQNNSASWIWSLRALAPVAWLAAIDIAAHTGQVQWTERAAGLGVSHFAAGCGAVFVSLLYAGVSFLRHPAGMDRPEEATALGWSMLAHLLLFLGLFLVLEIMAGLAGLFRQPAKIEFWLFHLLLAGAVGALVRTVVWPSLGFSGVTEILFSSALSLTLAALNGAVALRLSAGHAVSDGIAAAVSPATLGLVRSWRSGVAAALAVGLIGGCLAVQSAALDWNYLLQKLTAAGIWLASFACFYAIGARRARARHLAWFAVPILILGAYKGLEAAAPPAEPALERWAGYDASFRLVRQFLTPPRPADESFFHFLDRNTNIAAAVRVNPVPVDLTPSLARSEGPLPDIFVFTIDSLRPDYLSPYNPAVAFTPSIAAFGRESTVFENAFTRYGGTGLSEPAIWSGALLLHKQYIVPFAPMNALEKLVNAEQYQVFLSRDPILKSILTPSAAVVELDAPRDTMALQFSRTLDNLEEQIDRRTSSRPIFAYTQPQDLHISVIQREGATVPQDERYDGFYAPYASRAHRVDTAFGKFIAFLKARGIYDHSIIVLTADHGDSLGEEGRWGHAYTLFPEIVRVPLLMHLPEDLRAKVSSDPGELAFETDITPSLYYLLGHRPIQKNPLFGSPLFTETPAERRRDPQASYLLASSYGSVYGILSNRGHRLYVADGVNYQNYLFDVAGRSSERRTLSPELQRQQDELIRGQILSVNRFYHFGEAREAQP